MANRITFGLNPKDFLDKATYDPDDDGVIAVANTEADMTKAVYDPDDDGVIAVAQTEADMRKADYDADDDKHVDNPSKYALTVVPSDDIIAEDTSESSMTGTDYIKIKEFQIILGDDLRQPVKIRVVFNLRGEIDDPSCYAYGRIYVNDNPVGEEHQVVGNQYQTITEDIEGIKNSDKIQLYAKTNASSWGAYCNYFSLRGRLGRVAKDLTIGTL